VEHEKAEAGQGFGIASIITLAIERCNAEQEHDIERGCNA